MRIFRQRNSRGRGYSLYRRQWEVTKALLQFIWLLLWDFIRGKKGKSQRRIRARWLVAKLVELGPTFIKIGQVLSNRPDLIPLEYVEELARLQDRVPPFLSEEAIRIIEEELGGKIEEIFEFFERVPLAAASLGQVHRARLKNGEYVVVKVQRRDLDKLFDVDFKAIENLIWIANLIIPDFRKYEIDLVAQEFFEILRREIDYIKEGENAERFRYNFRDNPRVVVPKVYWEYTTKRVITMEYLPGIKIDDREALIEKNIPIKPLIELGVCTYLKQLLEDGFFQSDPHPGNMAVREDGAIIFYDFGAMAEVNVLAKEQMVQTFFAILQKDTDRVLEALMQMGLIKPTGDMTPVRRLISFLLNRFLDKPLDVNAFREIGAEIYQMFEKQPFRLPPQLTFVIKALTTLDGIARSLDPNYSLLAASQPFVKSLTRSNSGGNIILVLAREGKRLLREQLQKPPRWERAFNEFQKRLEEGELQIRCRSLEEERIAKSIYLAVKSLIYACLTGFSFLNGILLANTNQSGSWVFFCLGGLFTLLLLNCLVKMSITERFFQ